MARFQKGQIANPTGRPAGSKDRRTELRQLLQPHAAELIQKAVEMALEGDSAALRICIDRIVPTLRSTPELVSIPLPTTGNLAEQGNAIFHAAATGKLNADEASSLMSILAGQVRIIEATSLDDRIQALEEQLIKKGGRL